MTLSYIPCAVAVCLIVGHMYAYYSGFIAGVLLDAAEGYPSRSRRVDHEGPPPNPLIKMLGRKTKVEEVPEFISNNIATAQHLLLIYTPIGTLMFLLVLIAYLRTTFTAPGYVPSEPWSRAPTVVDDGSPIPHETTHFVTLVSHKGELRYCRRCSQFKPDDAHHCSQCEKCVHRMDHHCPWVNNCVGRNNTKFFIQFLLYISLGSSVIVAQVFSAYWMLRLELSLNSLASHIMVLFLVIGCSCFALFLGCFGGAQLYMVYQGDSTLGRVHDHLAGKDHFYDVFGRPPHWIHHLLPTSPYRPPKVTPLRESAV